MKSQAELPIVGLIISFTIVAGILAVPVLFRLTTAQQLDSTYKFENTQHALLALSYSTTDNGQSSYEHIGSNYLLKSSVSPNLKNDFEKVVARDYCISIKPTEKEQVILLSKESTSRNQNICVSNTQFNAPFVLPYNKQSLVEVIRIGVK